MDDLYVNPEVSGIVDKINLIRSIGFVPPEALPQRKLNSQENIDAVIAILESGLINDLNGYFQNHRPNSPYAILDDEYKVQDLIFCLLHPVISDLHYEDPKSKTVGSISHVRVDFSCKSLNFYLEIKYINSREKAKAVEAEISEDMTKYGKIGDFRVLIFFIYCNGYNLPNKEQFEKGFSGSHSILGNNFETICIVN